VEAEEQMVIERETGAGRQGVARGRERERYGGGGRGQKREKRGRVRTVATSGGTNGTLVSVWEEGAEEEGGVGVPGRKGKPGSRRYRRRRGMVVRRRRWLTVGTHWR